MQSWWYDVDARHRREMKELFVLIILLILAGALAIWMILLTFNFAEARACVELGYPELIMVDDVSYCHRVEDGTDVIRPLAEIEEDR